MVAANAATGSKLLVFVCFLGLSASLGPMVLSTFSLFMLPMAHDLGYSRGSLSLLFAFANGAIVAASPVWGVLLQRIGPGKVILAGGVLTFMSLAALALSGSQFVAMAAAFVCIGLFGSGVHTFVYISALAKSFSQDLGMIFGIAMTGVGAGQSLAPVLSQLLIAHFGWRGAYAAIGCAMLLVSGGCGLYIHNALKTKRNATPSDPRMGHDVSASQALRTVPFWALCLCFALTSTVAAGCNVHLVPLLTDRHVSINSATAMVAAAGVALTLGRLIGGYLLDKVGVLFVGSLMFSAVVLAVVLLLSKVGGWLLFAVPLCTGTVLGIEGDLIPYLARHRFGVAAHTIVYSWFFAFFSLGMVVGPIIMGVVFDHYGNYKVALVSFVLISIVTLCIYVTLLVRTGQPATDRTDRAARLV